MKNRLICQHMAASLTLLLLVSGMSLSAQNQISQIDVTALLRQVKTINKPGLPGPIALIGKNTATLVAARVRGDRHLPLIAVARYGKGSVLAFGHNGFLSAHQFSHSDVGTLLLNYLNWSQHPKDQAIVTMQRFNTETFLDQHGLKTRKEDSHSWAHDLKNCPTLIIGQGDVLSQEHATLLRAWVAGGGRLITGGLVWGWRQLNPRKDYKSAHFLNQALAPMGLFLDGGTIQDVIPPEKCQPAVLRSCSAFRGLSALRAYAQDPLPQEISFSQAGHAVTAAVRWLPEGQEKFLDEVRLFLGDRAQKVIPTSQKPLTTKDVFPRLALTIDHLLNLTVKPREVQASPSALDFPGQPAPADKAMPKTIKINPKVPGWHSTGLYARAGQVLRVRMPKRMIGQQLRLRIGAHRDELWHLGKWKRHPEITRSWPITENTQEFASPHGGLVYIETPRNSQAKPFQVTIHGAVPALHFILGETTLTSWKKSRATATAPWAELSCDLVTLTVKRESAAQIEDPRELLQFWQGVIKLYADLGMRPLDKRPQRFVADRQISAGWLHSGYPIMMQLVHSDDIVNLEKLRDAPKDTSHGWGFWHELGHNHQQAPWTFRGTTEVTCNLFSLYVDQQIRHVKPVAHSWPRGSRIKIGPFIKKNRSFSRWQKEPGLALWTYILIQEEFGWEPFKIAFAEYQKMPPSTLPKTDKEKRDQFMISMSLACKRDLAKYFDAWAIPISPAAKLKTKHLKTWMPKRIEAFRNYD